MPKFNLAGRTVVITGSTGGLGTALAQALRERGANLALVDLELESVDAQAAKLGPQTVVRGWTADVRDLVALEQAMSAAAEHFGRIDTVIANAGIAPPAVPLWDLEGTDFERAIDINLNGVWRTFRAGVPHVEKTKGYLLAISSMAAFVHGPLNGPYCAAKAGVWAFADSTRLELRDAGVGVGTAHPTFFPTPMMEHVHADPAASTVWGGNQSGLWKMVPREVVVDAIVDGIENRSDLIVAPKALSVTARIPGIVRPFVDRFGFPRTTIRNAIALAIQNKK
ncbi:SDR family NAD(P)-dependent oxidoreductase [Mycobacterium vicinigordonae]|uniref:SDR family NAD(P)-dependent oxidoreductase n=1 Tax=Mycobacterium vicinigordonae TaxID=1719132 RepID=A0A7D6HSB0_9MYCO|nr:SDR family NAD(P)-dependent oxidoreductase [Mycobacterium vicinigordonae]QLL05353.1 SDR family NAD(P)-dependent oxidoreductase [Mycobacterium vicinigordonae]